MKMFWSLTLVILLFRAVQVSAEEGTTTLNFHLFDSRSMPDDIKLSVTERRQSRNMCPQLAMLAALGKVQYLAGTHTFDVHFIDGEGLRGKTILVNGETVPVSQDFGPGNPIKLVMGGLLDKKGQPMAGRGAITVPQGWATEESAMVVVTPWTWPHLLYPPSGSLKTYAPAIATLAGAGGYEGELKFLLTFPSSNYCFAK